MMPIQVMVVPVWVESLGWMLVHSLWQLAVVAVLTAVLLRLLRSRSARSRYAVAVAMLALMAIGPVATWCLISVEPVPRVSSSRADERTAAVQQAAPVVQKPVTTEAGSVGVEEAPGVEGVVNPLAVAAEQVEVSAQTSEVSIDSTSETPAPALLLDRKPASTVSLVRESIEKIARAIKPRLPILVSVWLLGVLICSIRPIWGLWIQWRLRHSGLQPVPESIQAKLDALIQKLRLTRAVRIAESALVKVPLVVGYLHPIILLPASVITGLTSAQLEAVLAHELAHVRRHDWLINTLQVIAETLLFYHPAVWWLSSRIRQERELCCDDIALGLNVDKAVFARTLLTLEELRQNAMVPAMAATGGDLKARVRRLLITPHATPSSGGGTIMGMLVVVTSLVLMVTSLFASGPPVETKKSSVNSATVQRDEDATPDADEDALLAAGQKDNPDPKQETARQRSIQVLDENEQPVVGAEVGLQFQHDSEKSFNIDGIISAKTNEKGVVQVDAPGESDNVYVTIKADGFGEFSEQQQATGASIIRLKRGRVVHVRAVDESGSILRKAVPLLVDHRVWGREFQPQDDGTYKSPTVDMQRRLMRVVSSQENGPMLFSELVDVSTAKADDDGVLELVLRPGTKLVGRLDDAVPRPISEGYVQLMVVEGPDHRLPIRMRDDNRESRASRLQPWTWEDSTAVRPDGTFTFESVPAGGIAQIHVVVDGFMSINPPLEDLAASLQALGMADENTLEALKESADSRPMWPHFVTLDQSIVETVVHCGPTASCDFRILDPAGNPVPDATVSFSPNGIFFSGALFIPGSNAFQDSSLVDDLFRGNATLGRLSPDQHESPLRRARRMEHEFGERSFLSAKADSNGIVRVRNLPGGTREGFRVTAEGFVLPRSPLYSVFPDDRREAYVDLIAGETLESTIYLEREQTVEEREILVIDDEGNPLQNVTVTLAEMRVGPKDWQLWSVQRFGSVQSAKSDSNGRIVLSVPSQIEQVAVERLRLAINYDGSPGKASRGGRDLQYWVNGGVVNVPLKSDGGLVAIVKDQNPRRQGKAVYGQLSEILTTQTPEQLLNAMIKTPNLAILRQLLTTARSKQPEPVELLDEGRFGGESKGVRVHLIPSGESLFALVGARVRPVDGTRNNEADMSNLPECVFVFDSDGNPVAALGGEIGTTGAGDPDSTDILCLGPEEDWFVRVTRFQENGPFVYQSVYYRIGEPLVSSLKYYHYANSNSWSNGPEKITRHGDLNFEFPDSRNDYAGETVGVTAEGVAVNGTIFWDGDKNQFFGAPAQSVEGRPLYKVDTEWSKDFSALNPKADQMVLSGGIREYDHWYGWNTVVPKGHEATVRVSIPQASGESKIMDQDLAAGRHTIQFQAKPSVDGMTAKLQLGYGEDQKNQSADLPFKIEDQKQAPAVVNVVDAQKSVRLVERPLEGSEKTLTLEVILNPLTDAGK